METIKVIDVDGTQLEVELISVFENHDNKYLVYTKGERQKSGNLILYITRLTIKDDVYCLENITDDKEWDEVKKLMSRIINK